MYLDHGMGWDSLAKRDVVSSIPQHTEYSSLLDEKGLENQEEEVPWVGTWGYQRVYLL